MSSGIIETIKNMSNQEKRNIDYEIIKSLMKSLSVDDRIKLSNAIGYPVFTRKCMGELEHDFVLLQDGAAAIIVDPNGRILLQKRADKNNWGLPGGCQELGETFEEVIVREVKEETNLDVLSSDLEVIDVVSGMSRKNSYPNGDVVINNTVLYCIDKYSGDLKWDEESKDMQFFDLDNLPKEQNDPDLILAYKRYLTKKKK